MNLRKNNGISGIDISIAVVAMLMFIPTAFGITYNLEGYRAGTKRAATSVDLAVGIIEEAKGIALLGSDMDDIETELKKKYALEDETASGNFSTVVDKENVSYKLDVTYENPSQYEKEDISTHLAKKINVKVTYPIGNNTKDIEISKIIEKNIN